MTTDDLESDQPVMRAGARQLPRLRHRVDAAAVLGGTVLLETLDILEGFPMADMRQGSAASLHLIIEAMKRA